MGMNMVGFQWAVQSRTESFYKTASAQGERQTADFNKVTKFLRMQAVCQGFYLFLFYIQQSFRSRGGQDLSARPNFA